jgi:hypothetical protein
MDTGWFVDDINVNGTAATVSSEPGNWLLTNGEQNNNWVLQLISPCDLTPGVSSTGERHDNQGTYVYRLEGDNIKVDGFSTGCLNTTKDSIVAVISNLPTGDLTYLDADYLFRLTNTGNKQK